MAFIGDNGCFAWVSVAAHGEANIQDSYGVSSVSRIQLGTHQVNFSSFNSNTNYAVVGECGALRNDWDDGDDDNDHGLIVLNRSSGSVRLGAFDFDDGNNDDPKRIFIACYSTAN